MPWQHSQCRVSEGLKRDLLKPTDTLSKRFNEVMGLSVFFFCAGDSSVVIQSVSH